jgi:outer membrane protein OmpA-like peptidoglycan-associated protein
VLIGAASGAAIGAASGTGWGVLGGAVIGGVAGGHIGHVMQQHYTLIDILQCNGVQVVLIGDEVMIIVPTDRFYKRCSPVLNPQYYCILNKVAEFISKFDKIDVKVTGYTDNTCSWARNLVLSQERAEAMVDYLQLKGIDARILYGVGCGADKPIANNATMLGRQQNRRIVITFRKIVDKVWY